MGAWGSSLYANDTTCDVRDKYRKYLEEQLSNEEAYKKILEDFNDCMGDSDEEPLFWYALADSQWKVGRLTEDVKQKALDWIDKEGGIELWNESKSGPGGWKKTLDKLKTKLETEQPKEKRVKKPTLLFQNFWEIGDVYAYQFNTDISKKHGAYGKYMILQKIAEEPHFDREGLVMRTHTFDRLFDAVPTLDDLKGLRLLPLEPPNNTRNRPLHMNHWLELTKKKEYPIEHLTFIGNMDIPLNNRRRDPSSSLDFWSHIEYQSQYFQLWQNIEYKETEPGIFWYPPPQ